MLDLPAEMPADCIMEERFALALDSYRAGYFLIDIVPLVVDRVSENDLLRVKSLASWAMVDALIFRGSADWRPLEGLAGELGVRVAVFRFGHHLCEERLSMKKMGPISS